MSPTDRELMALSEHPDHTRGVAALAVIVAFLGFVAAGVVAVAMTAPAAGTFSSVQVPEAGRAGQ